MTFSFSCDDLPFIVGKFFILFSFGLTFRHPLKLLLGVFVHIQPDRKLRLGIRKNFFTEGEVR